MFRMMILLFGLSGCKSELSSPPISGSSGDICDSKYNSTAGCDMTYGIVIDSLDNVHSFGVCSLRCSGHDHCLSVKYDQLNHICELNSERYPVVSTGCTMKVRYAKISKNSCRKRINDACIVTSECTVQNSQCFNSKCQCNPGYSYRMVSESCLTWYNIDGYNNDVIGNAVSGDVCKQACADERGFVCRTVDYWPARKECYLSVATAFTAPNSFTPDSRIVYYHRNCE